MADAKRAVVIGIDNYTGKVEKLSGAVLDATEVYQVLTTNGGFEIKDEHFLTNADATSEKIRAAISDLFWQSEEKCGTALFYFAGHGRHDHLGYGYLLPHDADAAAPFVKGICIQELKRLFVDSKVNNSAVMVLDCCYSGIATATRGGGLDEVDAIKNLNDALRLESTGSGRFILASARADEKARERKQKHARDGDEHIHGLYSFHLIEALRGAAADKDGYISLGGVIRHIDDVFRKNDPDGIPPILAAGIDMDGIWLTAIAERVSEHLEKRYDLIAGSINVKTPRDLLTAIDEIIDLESRGAGDKQKLTEFLKQIDESVEDFKQKCSDWWYMNNSTLYRDPDVDRKRWFVALQELLTDLTVENYRKRDLRTRGFLTEIVEAIVNDQNYRAVTKYMRDEKRAPRIGSESIRASSGD
jgi:Caspase domain